MSLKSESWVHKVAPTLFAEASIIESAIGKFKERFNFAAFKDISKLMSMILAFCMTPMKKRAVDSSRSLAITLKTS